MEFYGGSALTDDINVPQNRSVETMSKDIPITYVPSRNIVFSFCLVDMPNVNGI